MADYNPSLQLAAGHNGAGSLVAIEDVLTLTDTARGLAQSLGNYTDGIRKFRSDGTLYTAGYPSTFWRFAVMTFAQYVQFQTTYCGGAGGLSGLVTIKTNTTQAAVYANYNATLILPRPSELRVSASRSHYVDVDVRFIRMEAL